MTIAVLSDTHGLLRPKVLEVIKKSDAIIHGGDINSQNIIDGILAAKKPKAPLYIVRGNNDKEWAGHLSESLEFTIEGVNFFLVHNKKDVPGDLPDVQIIIFGHSHKYSEETKDDRLWLNPGSCGKRRFNQEITMAALHLEKGKWRVEKMDIPPEAGEKSKRKRSDNLLLLIESIIAGMERGWTTEKITKDLQAEPEFVDQICRIYVTHPGVTANGILDKIEANHTRLKGFQ
ncbi:MAG: metallophosphoesterase family protein [Lachnospiraceae bacterium]|nr:metallophosphoesterase family protein [Lachnospiraceae bacterium]